ncbi:MAG TPA: YHS domain-containing protein [Thermoanaerobaculia bacterium]|nr:YHS domain-containing protein [Thermoanaerobaculia bacterium]
MRTRSFLVSPGFVVSAAAGIVIASRSSRPDLDGERVAHEFRLPPPPGRFPSSGPCPRFHISTRAAETVDPVCRMGLAVDAATAHASFDGRTYYFCSATCRSEFQRAPTRFAASPPSSEATGR